MLMDSTDVNVVQMVCAESVCDFYACFYLQFYIKKGHSIFSGSSADGLKELKVKGILF